jgi:ABC-type multidrug transport system fused ATPase/permease subunit
MKNDITKFLSCKLQIACWLVALFILLMIGFRSCSLRKDVVHHTYVYQPLNVDSLSKPPFLLRVRSDSVLTQLDSRVSQLETARDRDIDGVRQEVQNQINLISSWISIWLALIGFSGVLIPLAFQLKLRRDDEKKMQKTVAELQKKSDEVISKMKETVAELKKEVEEAISGMDVKVAELQRKSDEAISKMKETLAEQQTKVEEVISGMDKKEAELRKHNEKQL